MAPLGYISQQTVRCACIYRSAERSAQPPLHMDTTPSVSHLQEYSCCSSGVKCNHLRVAGPAMPSPKVKHECVVNPVSAGSLWRPANLPPSNNFVQACKHHRSSTILCRSPCAPICLYTVYMHLTTKLDTSLSESTRGDTCGSADANSHLTRVGTCLVRRHLPITTPETWWTTAAPQIGHRCMPI